MIGGVGLLFDEPTIWTPSAVKAEMTRVRGVLDAVNLDVSAATGAGTITNDEWLAWRKLYEAAHKYVDEASSLWGSNAQQARDYERQAGIWRDLVKSRGGKVSGTGPRPQTSSWDKVGLATVLVVGFVAYKVLK